VKRLPVAADPAMVLALWEMGVLRRKPVTVAADNPLARSGGRGSETQSMSQGAAPRAGPGALAVWVESQKSKQSIYFSGVRSR